MHRSSLQKGGWRDAIHLALLLGLTGGCTDILISGSSFFFHLDASSSDVRVGESVFLVASFGEARCELVWKSENPRIARVDPDRRFGGTARGRVIGVSTGATVIIIVARCAEPGRGGDILPHIERRRRVTVHPPG